MFCIDSRVTSAALRDNDEANSIIYALKGEGYNPTLRTLLDSAYSPAGVNRHRGDLEVILPERYRGRPYYHRPGPLGELFFSETHAFVFDPSVDKIRVSGIRHHSVQPQVDDFCEKLASAARINLDGRRLRGMSFEWEHLQSVVELLSPRLRRHESDESLSKRQAEYSEEDASNASLLVNQVARNLLMRIAQVRGKARVADTQMDSADTVAQTLLDTGLLRKEYLILCRQDSHTICSLPNKDQLEHEMVAGFKCSVCGKQFKDENIQEILVLGEPATMLLEGSHWMTIWVTEQLKAAGIHESKIVWNAAAGEDEVDIIADIHGSKVFFELKDRSFGLGDAYPFVFRVERYGADRGVVISTDRIAEEVKNFFKEKERPSGGAGVLLQTIEGLDEAKRHLPQMVDDMSRVLAIRIVDTFSENIGPTLVPIMKKWMDKVARQAHRTES